MKPILSKLEDVARKARERAPSPVRGILHRLESAYRARRAVAAPAAPVASASAAAEIPAPTPAVAPKPRPINWELRTQAELVDHIEQHYHAGLRRDLPALIDAALELEREHAAHAEVPAGLAVLLADFFAALDSHMMKEERMLFPVLRNGARGGELDMPMRMMEREHDGHADELEKIRVLTRDLAAPPDATPAWTTLYDDLATLETELRQHIYLENNVLFARGGR